MHLSHFVPKGLDGKPKIVFFGTQDFGAAMLQALIDTNQYEIIAVVTQPDRPAGRGNEVQQPPAKLVAEKYNLMVLQPETLKTFTQDYQMEKADAFVVCQYGLIIPQAVLDLPKHGTLNVHTSLLPKYRGASPIQSAIIHGETETGVTIMLMDAKMDHGGILMQEKIAIDEHDTYGTLSEKMKPLAARLLVTALPRYLALELHPRTQNDADATYCKMFTRESGRADWRKTPHELYNMFRGLTPWPGLWTTWDGGQRLKLLKFLPTHIKGIPSGVVQLHNRHLFVGCKNGAIELQEVQPEGKKPMDAMSFYNGNPEIVGDELGK